MFKGQLSIFLFIFVHDSWCVIDPLYRIAKEVRTFYLLLDEVDLHSITGRIQVDENPAILRLRNQIDEIHEQLNEIENYVESRVIDSWLTAKEFNYATIVSLEKMQLFIAAIHNNYRKFNTYVIGGQLENLVESVFPNIESDIIMIRKMMTNSKKMLSNEDNLVAAVTHSTMRQYKEMCNTSQPISEILVQIFRITMIAEIKTHVMLGFANKYQYTENRGWDRMNSRASSLFQTYFGSYVNTLGQYLSVVEDSYLRACDPENGTWILNDNYLELKGTPKAIIFRHRSAGCLLRTCEITGIEKSSQCYPEYYEEQDECPNRLTNCTDLGSVKACLLKGSPRRLQYINSTALGLLGKNFECQSDTGYIRDDKKDPNNEYFSCSCDCYGDQSKISLAIMESEMERNMIITGLRFIRKDNILFIQIKEALLGADGYVYRIINKWRPIPKKIDDSHIHFIDRENRIFFLDDLRLPAGYVLTGIKFNRVTRGTATGFALELSGVPFNYTTGELIVRNKVSLWKEMDVSGQPVSFKPISSIETILPHEPSSRALKYVQLERSSLTHDFGQSTLPLFDAVPVTTNPPSALGGIGIFHKGRDGYAGFISLRAYGIKYEKYFNDFKLAHIIEDVVVLN